MIEFQNQCHFKIWTLVFKYIENQTIWGYGSVVFRQKHDFLKSLLHTVVLKLRRGWATSKKDLIFKFFAFNNQIWYN